MAVFAIRNEQVMLPPEFVIEAMQESDIEKIMVIERQVQECPWNEKIFVDCLKVGYQGYLIRHNVSRQIVCFSFYSFAADECHVLNLATDTAFQRQGFAKILLQYCLEIYRQKNITRCYLEVRESNLIARELYENLGFTIAGIRRDYYPTSDGREDALVMSLVV